MQKKLRRIEGSVRLIMSIQTLDLKYERLMRVLPLAVIIAIAFCAAICLFMLLAVIGSLDGKVQSGYRSGAPTAFAVYDIPAQYMTIFLKAQEKYDLSWAILAAICKTESKFGQNMGPSSEGAIGFMQFMPETWSGNGNPFAMNSKTNPVWDTDPQRIALYGGYGVDADGDGIADPFNPWDAVYSAANMLRANRYNDSPEEALYLYNRDRSYVKEVMNLAYQYSSTMTPTGDGIWPLTAQYTYISSGYGLRIHPITEEYREHDGIDIPAPEGTPVFAVRDGSVDWDRSKGGYGICVVLNHRDCRTLYAHLSGVAVKSGDEVKAGQVIGYVGSTGDSTGPHLHFSVYVNHMPCNPEEWLAVPSQNY